MRNFEKELTNEPNFDPAFLDAEKAPPQQDYNDWESLKEVPFAPEQAEAASQSMDGLVPANEAQTNAQSMEDLAPQGEMQTLEEEPEQSEDNCMQVGY